MVQDEHHPRREDHRLRQLSDGQQRPYDRHVYMDNSGRILFGTYPGGVRTIMSPGTYNNNQWHHVVASMGFDGGQRLFIDGQLVAQNPDVISGQYYSGYWRSVGII